MFLTYSYIVYSSMTLEDFCSVEFMNHFYDSTFMKDTFTYYESHMGYTLWVDSLRSVCIVSVSTGSCTEIKSQKSQRDCLMAWSPCNCCECCICDSITFNVKKIMSSVCCSVTVNMWWSPNFTTSEKYSFH